MPSPTHARSPLFLSVFLFLFFFFHYGIASFIIFSFIVLLSTAAISGSKYFLNKKYSTAIVECLLCLLATFYLNDSTRTMPQSLAQFDTTRNFSIKKVLLIPQNLEFISPSALKAVTRTANQKYIFFRLLPESYLATIH